MRYFRLLWSRSKTYRVVVIVTFLIALLRATAGWFYWTMDDSGITIPDDLLVYLDAATNLQLEQDLYVIGELPTDELYYQYPPAYALAFAPFLRLPAAAILALLMTLHIAAYGLFYIRWGRIFHRLGLDQVGQMMAWTLPIWGMFASFWNWFTYLNIGVFVALCATLLIEAVLDERLGWAILWLSLTLQTKPYWAFPAAIPLLLGRHRFFFRLMALAIAVYVAIAGATILTIGPSYAWQQYVDYGRHLLSHRDNFPWRGPDKPFLGYYHSVTQIIVYLLGVTPTTMHLATGIKVLLLVPLAVISIRYLLRPIRIIGHRVPQLSLEFAFALFLGASIWLDVVCEVFLSIVIFTYLAATLNQRWAKTLVWVAFLPHALAEVWLLMASVGPISDDGYALWNPSIHIPFAMVVVLVFYALLVKRLWTPREDSGEIPAASLVAL
jgi:hypothetical protein